MPSGAKKRKAAKKKMQDKVHHFVDKVHNFVENKGSHSHSHSNSQGSEDPKNYNEEGGKEVNLGKGNVGGEFKNGNRRSSSSSSSSGSSSSSDNDEVVVEKEESAKPESGKLEASSENSGVSEAVNEAVEESIPVEESVKQVVSLPQGSATVSDSQLVDNSSTCHVIEWDLKSDLDEGFQPIDDKIKVPSGVEKIEEKVTPSKPSSATVTNDEGLFPQSSGVKGSEGCCGDDQCKESETQKYAEEQPLLSSAPMPVRRTSWMNCCGLLEVFSGGSSG